MSCRDHSGSILFIGLLNGYKICSEKPYTKAKYIAVVKGHASDNSGQPIGTICLEIFYGYYMWLEEQ